MVVVSEAHLRRVLTEYIKYFNQARPHQGIKQHVPEATEALRRSDGGTDNVVAFPILGGLHHEYRRAA
ncbi:MAG: hypothetical protein NVS4B8_24390 [Herpetosiphon sp.]